MRIAVDASSLRPPLSGVGRYLLHLLPELVPLAPGHDFTLFFREPPPATWLPGGVREHLLPGSSSFALWQNTALARALQGGRFDLFWSPNYTLPLRCPVPAVVTVHDVSWRAIPGNYFLLNRLYKHRMAGFALRRARLVFTDSRFSAAEIAARYPAATGRIQAIHLAVDDCFRPAPAPDVAAFRSRHRLGDGPLIGFLGSFFRRRHLPLLIAAFHQLRRDRPDLRLVLVGRNHDSPALGALLAHPAITWHQSLPEAELPAFYSALDLFVYLSDYEGFGLPPLEALACGTVPLVSATSSLAEVFAGISILLPRNSRDALERACREFLADASRIRAAVLAAWTARRGYFRWRRAGLEYARELDRLAVP